MTGKNIAYFITPHGYGHAARAAAVMNSILEIAPGACFEIFTRVPIWFFNMSLPAEAFHYHEVLTDIGVVQTTSMDEDLPETARRLAGLMPYRPALVAELARQVCELGCERVLCDIAPLGIAVAKEAGLPSVLIENFTWDWIYAGYVDQEPRLAPFIAYLTDQFAQADTHIRTIPYCADDRPADFTSNVAGRKPRTSREVTREQLGVPQDAAMVMVSMGGILTQYPFLPRLESSPDTLYLVPGGSDRYERRGSLVVIPHHSTLYHPDLVYASDAIVGKLGYSTLAEAYGSGIPFGYIPRALFPESPPMARFAREQMNALEIKEADFFSGAWLDLIPALLSQPRRVVTTRNGADEIASYLFNLTR
jgi:hypothetical protein